MGWFVGWLWSALVLAMASILMPVTFGYYAAGFLWDLPRNRAARDVCDCLDAVWWVFVGAVLFYTLGRIDAN